MREFHDVKKRDVARAFATIRVAVAEKCDRLTDWSSGGNALEQAVALRLDENLTKALDFAERFLLGERAVEDEEESAHEQEDRTSRARRPSGS